MLNLTVNVYGLIDEMNKKTSDERMDLSDLAEWTGIPRRQLYAYMDNRRDSRYIPSTRRGRMEAERIKLSHISKLCDFFNCTWDVMVDDEGLRLHHILKNYNADLTISSLARYIDMSHSTLINFARNKTSRMDKETLVKLCHFFQCGVDELLILGERVE